MQKNIEELNKVIELFSPSERDNILWTSRFRTRTVISSFKFHAAPVSESWIEESFFRLSAVWEQSSKAQQAIATCRWEIIHAVENEGPITMDMKGNLTDTRALSDRLSIKVISRVIQPFGLSSVWEVSSPTV